MLTAGYMTKDILSATNGQFINLHKSNSNKIDNVSHDTDHVQVTVCGS